MKGKGPQYLQYSYDIHSFMINSGIIENNVVDDTKTPLLRCIPFISKGRSGDRISTGQYMNYQSFTNLQIKKLLKIFFHSIKIELRDNKGEKISFVSVGIPRVVLLFAKFRNTIFNLNLIRNGCSNAADIPIFRGQARALERFAALAQTLGRTAIPFIKKHIVPAAKRIGVGLFEIAAPEIGEAIR